MQVPDNTNSRATADLIFTSGHVHTVNARNDLVEAVTVVGGRILAIGSNSDIRAFAGAGTREIELRGRSLLPGFIDAHCHLTGCTGHRRSDTARAVGGALLSRLPALP